MFNTFKWLRLQPVQANGSLLRTIIGISFGDFKIVKREAR